MNADEDTYQMIYTSQVRSYMVSLKKNVFHELVVGDILDPAVNPNSLNMEGVGAPAGPQGPQNSNY